MSQKLTRNFLAFAFLLAMLGGAQAQGPSQCAVSIAAPTYQNGQTRSLSCDTAGNLRSGVSVSASVTGFAPTTTGTPISVTDSGVTGTLPAGAVVVAFNVGTTDPAFCKLGASATTGDAAIGAGNGWFAFTVGVSTQLTCITASGKTTTVNMVGGSGLPTGVGGGTSGGGGGSVTQGTVPWVVSNAGTFAVQAAQSGSWSVAQSGTWNITNVSGTVSLPTGASTVAKQPALGTAGTASTDVITVQGIASMTKLLVTPDSVALPANQSVNVAQINGVTPLMGAGNTGTGSPRATISTDQAALPTWGHGATGAAPPAGATYAAANTGAATTGGKLTGLITCDNHVFKHITSATDTLAVQGVTSQIIYVCGWRSRAAGTATWYLENTASTNANCSSSNTQLTGLASEVVNSGETLLAPFWTGLKNTVSNGLCINSTGTGGVDIDIWYTQF